MRRWRMIRPLLIGIVAGQRATVPLVVTSAAARHGTLPPGAPLASLLCNPVITGGTAALAAAEMAGNKMNSAPDRIVPAGLVARTLTAGYAGAAMAPRGRRGAGAGLAVISALGASYVGWRMRSAAIRKYGQTASGVLEDGLVLGSGLAVALTPRR